MDGILVYSPDQLQVIPARILGGQGGSKSVRNYKSGAA